MQVTVLIGALALGFFVARFNLLPKTWHKGVTVLGNLALVFLLFSMGISLGANPELVSSLPNLGMKALLLSLGAIGGSVFLVWLAVKVRRSAP